MNDGKDYVVRSKPLFDTFETFLNGSALPNRARQIHEVSTSGKDDSAERYYRIWALFHEQLAGDVERQRYRLTLINNQRSVYDILGRFFRVLDHTYHVSPLEVLRRSKEVLENGGDFLQRHLDISYTLVMSTLFELEMESSAQWQSDYVMANLSHWRVEAVKHDSAFQIAHSCHTMVKGLELFAWSERVGPVMSDVNEPRKNQLPFYLWEIRTRKLIIVSELGFVPRYTCVSHTWGRWMVNLESSLPTVELASVRWPIPRNTRFEVEKLPEMLASARWVTEYLWLDLLCIPQLEFDPSRRDKEIAKQAGIFVNSAACVAWLNDVEDWKRLLPAVTWLGLSYLDDDSVLPQNGLDAELLKLTDLVEDGHRLFQKQYYEIHSVADSELKEIEEHEGSNAGMADFHARYCCSRTVAECRALSRHPVISPRASSNLNRTLAFPDWFTSLWTLQEACLCPDMSLADSSFNYLANETGVHFTLQGIIMLVNITTRQLPRSVKQLRVCFPHDFGHSSPMNVIMMGNERECTSERAPAIMSVIGVTSWYEELLEHHGRIPAELPYVFGKYALPFVKEAASRIGPLFFGTTAYDSSNDFIGSMLPFFSGMGKLASFPFEVTAARMDATHRAWEIGPSGEVLIEEAIVIAASRNNSVGILPVGVTASVFGFDTRGGLDYDLQSILDRLSGGEADEVESFAIHLSQDTTKRMGIILAGAASPNTDKFLLAKAAAYSVEFSEDEATELLSAGTWPPVPKPLKVNWLAL